jgi:hypothetical protein
MFKRCGGRCSGISTTAVQLHKDVQMKGAKTTNKRNGQRDPQLHDEVQSRQDEGGEQHAKTAIETDRDRETHRLPCGRTTA